MVEWILVYSYEVSDLLHYPDDFITAGPPALTQCARNLSSAMAVCDQLGLPLHPGKCVGPAPVLTVLGIELDSVNQVAHLPVESPVAVDCIMVSPVLVQQTEVESLIGHLHHAAKVVLPDRTFLHRMIDLLCCFRKKNHPIRLNKEFHHDLQWWHQFLVDWHGVNFWLFPGNTPTAGVEVSSDAAGSLGFGVYLEGMWFTGSWMTSLREQSIAFKELFPVVITAHVWGHHWCRRHVLFRSNNDSVVHILNARTSKVPCLMHLLRTLLLAAACHSFSFSAQLFLESLIRWLMPFLTFIGRTFPAWLWRLIVTQLPFHRSCWRTSSPHFRRTVLFLFGSGSSSIYPQVICYSSVPVLDLLQSVRQDPLVWVSLTGRWMDALLACYIFGWFSSALFHQSVSPWGESPSYQTRFCGSSSQLSSLAGCHKWHQTHSGLPLI